MRGQGFALGDQQLTIGRAIENDVRIDDPHVSRRHAVIRRVNGAVVIEDVHSSGGIIVNDKRVARARVLRVGDRVRLGSVELELWDAATPPTEARTPARSESARPPAGRAPRGRGVLRGGLLMLSVGMIAAVVGYAKWAAPILRCIKNAQSAAGSCINPSALAIAAGGGLLVTVGAIMVVVGLCIRSAARREQQRA